ncbi:type 1 glutamine amidotransferase [Acidobacteriota bacterium]
MEVIKEAVERNLSILGSCYGHQLLAVALAGPTHVRRCDFPEIGWISLQIKEDNELLGKKGIAFSYSIHFDEVVNLDADFRILASSDHYKIQAFQFKNKAIWGIQAHPEISIPEGRMFLKKLISLYPETASLYKKALASIPKDSYLIHKIVKNYFLMNEVL